MQCPQCQTEVVDGAAFCNSCGSQIQERCQRCHTLNPPGSKYCHSCGGEIGSGPAAREVAPVSYGDPPPTPGTAQVCPRCNNTNEPGARYCFHCGLPLEGAATATAISFSVGAATYRGTPAGFWIRLVAYIIDCTHIRCGGSHPRGYNIWTELFH